MKVIKEDKKSLKESNFKQYKFYLKWSDGTAYLRKITADNLIDAWSQLAVKGWIMGINGYLEKVELAGDYSDEFNAYENSMRK